MDMAAGDVSPTKPIPEAHSLEVSLVQEIPEEFEEYKQRTRVVEDTHAQITQIISGTDYHIKGMDQRTKAIPISNTPT